MEKIAHMDDKRRIDEVLSRYPQLQSLITKNPDFYRLTRAQFGDSTPRHQQECRLSGILRYIESDRSFSEMIGNLERWLSQYPEYRTKKFGRKLSENFFSMYSEIEFYHHLKQSGLNPTRDPTLEINGGEKELDFLVPIDGKEFLIEVITPRASSEWEDAFDTGFTGFGDPEKGLGPKNRGEYSRALYLIQKEIQKHLAEVQDDGIEHPLIIAMNIRWTAREIMIGDRLPIFDKVPRYIAGILLYDDGNCKFFPSPYHSLSNQQSAVISGLMTE